MNFLLNTLQHRKTLTIGAFLCVCLLAVFAVSPVNDSGWSSGFTHPLHGGDHFLTMIAVGVWAAQLRGKAVWLLPVTFVSVMSLGGLAGASGLFLPIAELLILASCVVFSVLIVRKVRFSSKINVAIVAFFAFFHGFAHGQEISTSASLISYTLGFMIATLLLHGAGILIVKLLVLLFALFITQLVHAHTTLQQNFVKHTALTQTVNHQQLLADVTPSPPDLVQSQKIPLCHTATKQWLALCPIVPSVTANLPLWLDNTPQLDIRFLTNGVGVTAPPAVALFSNALSCVFPVLHSADTGSLVLTTTLFLIIIFYLATSFLSSGVGATSPPTGIFLSIHHCKIFLTPCPIHSPIQYFKPRHCSRAPPFGIFSALQNNNYIHRGRHEHSTYFAIGIQTTNPKITESWLNYFCQCLSIEWH